MKHIYKLLAIAVMFFSSVALAEELSLNDQQLLAISLKRYSLIKNSKEFVNVYLADRPLAERKEMLRLLGNTPMPQFKVSPKGLVITLKGEKILVDLTRARERKIKINGKSMVLHKSLSFVTQAQMLSDMISKKQASHIWAELLFPRADAIAPVVAAPVVAKIIVWGGAVVGASSSFFNFVLNRYGSWWASEADEEWCSWIAWDEPMNPKHACFEFVKMAKEKANANTQVNDAKALVATASSPQAELIKIHRRSCPADGNGKYISVISTVQPDKSEMVLRIDADVKNYAPTAVEIQDVAVHKKIAVYKMNGKDPVFEVFDALADPEDAPKTPIVKVKTPKPASTQEQVMIHLIHPTADLKDKPRLQYHQQLHSGLYKHLAKMMVRCKDEKTEQLAAEDIKEGKAEKASERINGGRPGQK